MLYQLILTVCLIASPAECKKQEFYEPLSMRDCLVEGQAYADIWLRQHPDWRLETFRCQAPKRPATAPQD